jgi:transposase
MRRLVARLAAKYGRLHFCYEAGPTGYGLYRLIVALGHACTVVAPSLIPRKPGDRVKTNRRDATTLARLLRAGELTAVWVPDPAHEAMRNLVRARTAASETARVHKQQVSVFLLRHGRSAPYKKNWGAWYWRWLQEPPGFGRSRRGCLTPRSAAPCGGRRSRSRPCPRWWSIQL